LLGNEPRTGRQCRGDNEHQNQEDYAEAAHGIFLHSGQAEAKRGSLRWVPSRRLTAERAQVAGKRPSLVTCVSADAVGPWTELLLGRGDDEKLTIPFEDWKVIGMLQRFENQHQ
jgi:hypothetical protein